MTLAQELVQGVDVWINTPRRPWEACGTSGMKVLVNGGLNLSELDGWWAEAYSAEVGWALGDGCEHAEPDWDAREAEALYAILENDIIPLFYARDAHGIPRAWVARIRASMARLAPHFSSNRMLCEYIECVYVPAAAAFRRRAGRERAARQGLARLAQHAGDPLARPYASGLWRSARKETSGSFVYRSISARCLPSGFASNSMRTP